MADNYNTEVSVVFCDASTEILTYDAGAWGSISARDKFQELVDAAKRHHSIFGKHPHPLKITLVHGPDRACEEFDCMCSDKQAVG